VVGVVAYAFTSSTDASNGQLQKLGWNENFESDKNKAQHRMTLPASTRIGACDDVNRMYDGCF
jgi:hypothetical protein